MLKAIKILRKIWPHIPFKQRNDFKKLFFLVLLTSIAEMASLGSALPFLSFLSSPEALQNKPYIQGVLNSLPIAVQQNFVLFLTIIFIISILIVSTLRLIVSWQATALSYAAGSSLGEEVFRKTISQPYLIYLNMNSSDIIAGITTYVTEVIHLLNAVFILISAAFIATVILGTLFFINWFVASVTIIGLLLIYGFVIYITHEKLKKNGIQIANKTSLVFKILQETLGGMRDIVIESSQKTYVNEYRNVNGVLRKAQAINLFISSSPRIIVECFGTIIIATVAYFLYQDPGSENSALPILAVFALGAQRLLPLIQQIYAACSGLASGTPSLLKVLNLLEQPNPIENFNGTKLNKFQKEIALIDVCFKYPNSDRYILKDVNLNIKKGQKVGIIGQTGAGKSTLVDILMGLIPPTSGDLVVDGVKITEESRGLWRKQLAHVPQSVFLLDASIGENIAFGIEHEAINDTLVKAAAEKASIAKDIERWPEKYFTKVGERGARLSGGQRQRIGIARAFYKDAEILFFDEATSALDISTEKAIIDSLFKDKPDLTLLMIAHRLSTLNKCDLIIVLNADGSTSISDVNSLVLGGG
jgi:ABC-type multidrug transport system fused ATPase/permease subunit